MLKLYEVYLSVIKAMDWLPILVARVFTGWSFFQNGKGKLGNIEVMTERFTEWGVPLPELNVYVASVTECVGGLMLVVGLGTRIVGVPLAFTMIVALLTAHRANLGDFSVLVDEAPIGPLCVFLLLIVTGSGKASLDYVIGKLVGVQEEKE